jgi:predicted alpha/beta superfamily hydrolase
LIPLILSACEPIPEVALPNTVVGFVTSKKNNVSYKLFISLPEGYNSRGHHSYRENYPVLYLLDPDVEFGLVENIAGTMINYDAMEPFIIVGIGYQNQDLSIMDSKKFWDQWTKNRARDYIPVHVSAGKKDFESRDHEYKGLSDCTGGSRKFKDFIEKELIPYINDSYRTSNERALFGHSQGELFVTWMMLNYPQIFEKYIILSPSVWIEKSQMMTQFRRLNHSEKVKAYFAVGSLEQDTRGSMVSDLELFYTALPNSKLFESKFQIIEGENHVSMVPEGLIKGLKYLFGKQDAFI